ncbi:nuclear transport factor 2 family protein [Streptomyces sp. DT199]|uniref:nuclear transport factor 2 family protein n=1 Tax=Streptomyces sp. DT199 TaxID=3393421 RepID=UPI003CF47A10
MNEEPDPADELHLARLAKSWAEVIVSDDPARIAESMADEWVIVSASGIDPRVASGALTHAAMVLRTDPRVRVHVDTALVTCPVTDTAHCRGERYDADEWTTDVFVRRQGRWLCVLSHITPAAPD